MAMPVFRWFAVLQLVVILPALASRLFVWQNGQESVLRMMWAGLVTAILLLGYLFWRNLPARMGKVYLPLGLAIATLGPSLGHFYMLLAPDWQSAPAPLVGAWQLVPLLFVPLVIIAVQYNYHAVTAYCLGTAALNIGLMRAALGGLNADMTPTFAMLVVRTFTFLVVGYSVVWLTGVQYKQRRALAEANRRLAQYAATLDQLATQRERNRIARELHDVLAHSLSGLAVQLEAVKTLWDSKPPKARQMLEQALAATDVGLTETRCAMQALRAAPLENLGLALAIADYAEAAAQRAGLQLELRLPEKIYPLPTAIEQDIYRVAQEAIENVVRHARARTISIALSQENGQVTLTIRDDGQGFDPQALQAGSERSGFGIRGMRERAEMLGGELGVKSQPAQGTTVQLIYREDHD
ncbi:MAG: sensor histidine kinase [Chloroflexota bacterium]